MKPRELGGAIGRADAIYVWVPYTEVVYEDDGVEAVVTPEGEEVVDVVEETEEIDEEPEEVGYWLAITKVQARELVADACTSDIEDMDIMAEDTAKGLYIGMGPLPE